MANSIIVHMYGEQTGIYGIRFSSLNQQQYMHMTEPILPVSHEIETDKTAYMLCCAKIVQAVFCYIFS